MFRWFEKLIAILSFNYNDFARIEHQKKIEKFLKVHPNWKREEYLCLIVAPNGMKFSEMVCIHEPELVERVVNL